MSARLAEVASDGGAAAPSARTLEAWDTAVRAWEQVPLRLLRAQARLAAAEAAAALGERSRCQAWLRATHRTAAECGAIPLRRQAADLARRVGLPLSDAPVPEPAAPPAGLTAREAQVLRLLAEGRTNARIAAELFISPKTASVHVSRILGRLGVPNRGAAAARARELDLV